MLRMRLSIGAMSAVLAVALPLQAQTQLRYQFKAGEKLNYVLEQKMDMTMSVMGQEIVMKINQTMDFSWHIQSVDAQGKAKIDQVFDRVRFTMDAPQGKVEYDSNNSKELDDPVGKILQPLFSGLVGNKFTMSMDRRGEVSDVTIPEKFKEAIKNIPNGGAGMDLFSEEGIKRLTSQTGVVFVEERVSKGKNWSRKTDMKLGMIGKIVTDNSYTFEGEAEKNGKKLEKIAIKTKLEVEPADNATVTMKIKEQDAKGTILFDNKTGRIVETTFSQDVSQEVGAMGTAMEQKIKQNLTLKLVDKK